jgi:MarR family transcriptional regulator for hemolysin
MTYKGEEDFDDWARRYAEFYEPGTRKEKEFRFTRKLVLAARRYTAVVDESVRQKTGHSRARWQTLSALAFSEGPVGTLELATRIAVRWPSLIRILNDLEQAGLIRREQDPNDRRSRLISITAEGRRVMGRVQDALDPVRSRVLATFSEEELVAVEKVLDRLFKILVQEIRASAKGPES